MTGLAALIGHSLRRRRTLLIAMLLVVVLFQFFVIFAAAGLEQSGTFRQLDALMPPFMKQLTNMTSASFAGLVLFGYSHPVVHVCLIALVITIGAEPAAEIESRFVDILMARPLPRATMINRSIGVVVIATVVAIACMLLATWVGLQWFSPPSATPPGVRVVLSLAGNLAALLLAFGGLAVVVAAIGKRRGQAAAVIGLFAFVCFVLDYVGRFWQPAEGASRLSLFHYFSPFAMIGGAPLKASDIIVLLTVFIVSCAVAHVAYRRRDL